MKIVWSNKIDNIFKTGHKLSEIGVNNWALLKEDALLALDKLVELQVPVLGGDVCELINGIVQYNYDNWYCEQSEGETKHEFLQRSISKARQYILNYQTQDPSKIYFAFVPGV